MLYYFLLFVQRRTGTNTVTLVLVLVFVVVVGVGVVGAESYWWVGEPTHGSLIDQSGESAVVV